MKFSLWPSTAHPPSEVFDIARWADATGWYGVWVADHYMPNSGSEDVLPGPVDECWAMLPAIAMITEHVRVGSLVAPTSVHHPAILANRAATIDHVSNGRMVLGIGAGWQINEHRAYGIELEAPKQRVDRFEEAIRIIRSLLTEDRTTFAGEHYVITDAPAEPKPVQSPLPILVGTGGNRMLRITARHADEWNTWGTHEQAADRHRAFNAACESVGEDPASKWTSVQALMFLTDDDDAKRSALEGPMGARAIAGSEDELAEQLGRYAATGFDEFIVPDFNLGSSIAERSEAYERIKSDVIDRM